MAEREKRNCFIAHIAGYNDGFPEMWHIRNTILDDHGNYSEGGDNFDCSEDLKNRDWKKNNLQEVFEQNGYQLYVNGFLPGRVSFNVLRKFIDTFFDSIWSSREYKFRRPKSLLDHQTLVETYVDITTKCFILSDYDPKIIGGKTQLGRYY